MSYHVFVLEVRDDERTWQGLCHSLGTLLRAGYQPLGADGETVFSHPGENGITYLGSTEDRLQFLGDESISAREIFFGQLVRAAGEETPTNSPADKNDRQ